VSLPHRPRSVNFIVGIECSDAPARGRHHTPLCGAAKGICEHIPPRLPHNALIRPSRLSTRTGDGPKRFEIDIPNASLSVRKKGRIGTRPEKLCPSPYLQPKNVATPVCGRMFGKLTDRGHSRRVPSPS
jgi:hypothetical protein